MSILAILAAAAPIVQAGTTIASGIMQNNEIKRSNDLIEKYYKEETAKQDKLNAQAQKNTERSQALNERAQRFTEQQTNYQNKVAENATNYNRLQNAANRYAEYLNTKTALTANRMSGFQKG